jgi:hypothetical protein
MIHIPCGNHPDDIQVRLDPKVLDFVLSQNSDQDQKIPAGKGLAIDEVAISVSDRKHVGVIIYDFLDFPDLNLMFSQEPPFYSRGDGDFAWKWFSSSAHGQILEYVCEPVKRGGTLVNK